MGQQRIQRAGRVAWSLVGLAAVVGVLGVVAWYVRIVWLPLILAGAIVFLLNPAVTALHRRGIPRAAGAALSYLAFLASATLVALAVVPLVADQAEDLSDDWPQVRADVERWINDRAERSENWIIRFPSVGEIEREVGGDGEGSLSDNVETVLDIGGRVVHVALILLLAPIIAFYLLVDLPHLRKVMIALVPEPSRHEVEVVARHINRAVGGFFRGQLMVALVVGVMVSIGLAVIDLPFWLIIGMVAGLFNIIPLIGPWVGAVPGILIALTTRDMSTALWVVAIMAGAQQIDNHFISPMVMHRVVKLHPAAVILALLAGGTIGGFFGLLLAVPTAAVLKIVGSHLWHTYVLGQPLEEVEASAHAADAQPGSGGVGDVAASDEDETAPPPAHEAETQPQPVR